MMIVIVAVVVGENGVDGKAGRELLRGSGGGGGGGNEGQLRNSQGAWAPTQ